MPFLDCLDLTVYFSVFFQQSSTDKNLPKQEAAETEFLIHLLITWEMTGTVCHTRCPLLSPTWKTCLDYHWSSVNLDIWFLLAVMKRFADDRIFHFMPKIMTILKNNFALHSKDIHREAQCNTPLSHHFSPELMLLSLWSFTYFLCVVQGVPRVLWFPPTTAKFSRLSPRIHCKSLTMNE